MRDERRRIQRPPVRVVARKGHGQLFTGAGAGDVAEETLARKPVAQIRAERDGLAQFFAVGIGQNRRRGGRGGENGFVDAEHQREFQIGIARAVNRADEHLVQHGRNDADGQAGEAGLQDLQPVAQRQGLVRKCEREIFQPQIHLLQDR